MNVTQNIQTESFGSKRALKAYIDRELRYAIASGRDALVYEYAKKLAADPPAFRRKNPVPESLGWFFPVGDVGARMYAEIVQSVQTEVERLVEQYQLDQGPDAAMWHRWLAKRVSFWAAQCASTAPMKVADRMAALFTYWHGIPFAHHYGRGAAVFYITDGTELGAGWRTLRDTVARGRCPEDPDYLRVVWAYHAERQVLVRLHYTRVHLPTGRMAHKWVVDCIWENMSQCEAEGLAWH